ncbi:hypothetical protein VCHA50P424_10132 [Vibrio chagasii]|nr:hypothetical protein VCHA50P424_10132 [Vibrio chagasii]CAH7196317.1 hypothetical protein VCHA53O464_170088 [Vibrio chagasii]
MVVLDLTLLIMGDWNPECNFRDILATKFDVILAYVFELSDK